jgi:Papain fold toxin 1, glutamine deamidase
VLREAGRAARDAAAGLGGSEGLAELHEMWRGLSAALDPEIFDRLAVLVGTGADAIEAVKRKIHNEVAAALAELEVLATFEVSNPGGLAPGIEAVVSRARSAIREAVRHGAGDLLEAAGPAADEAVGFAFPVTARLASSGSPPEIVDPTSVGSPAPSGPAPEDSGVLLMATGIASLGGSEQPSAPRVAALRGRYGERAIRGPSGVILSELTVGVVEPSLQRRSLTPGSVAQNSFTLTALFEAKEEDEAPEPPWLVPVATQAPAVTPGRSAVEPAVEPLDQAAYERHVLAQLGGAPDEAAQAVWEHKALGGRARGVAQAAHQWALDEAVERDEAGRPKRFPDLEGEWLRLVNGGGCLADPRRATNAAEVALSVVDTWLRGRPRAALPGTHQKMEKLERISADPSGFARLEAALKVQGHGACALVVQEWPHGEVHATTVHNQRGNIVYVDAQRLDRPLSDTPALGAVRMEVAAFGPEGQRVDLGY